MSQSVVGQAELDAARLLLERMGISPADLSQVRPPRPPAPTFPGYVPVVAATVTAGTLRAKVQPSIVVRANSRGGRSAAENLIGIRHVSGPLRTLIP